MFSRMGATASECLLGYLVLVRYFVLLLSAEIGNEYPVECPSSFECGVLGYIHFPFTNTANPECGLVIRGCDNYNADKVEIQLEHNQWYKVQNILQRKYEYNLIFIDYLPQKVSHQSAPPSTECLSSICTAINYNITDTILPHGTPLMSLQILNTSKFYKCNHKTHKIYEKPYANCGDSNKEKIIIGLSIGIGLAIMTIIALLVIVLVYKRRYNSSGDKIQPRNIYSEPSSNMNTETGTAIYFGVPIFSYEELQEATNNFDQARELGEGGFGTVYYGKLRDGREVAVKHLYKRNYRPVESFINEIQILTRLRHTNLVSLYGCTSRHSHELLLVYEYVPNGTLGGHLHGDIAKPDLMPWPVRMKIAIDTASALAYLHASDIIHRDVKTSNILLDNNFCVKVADFGLSRLFPNDVTHISTAPRGTLGYVDPDYRICYQLTTKSDVYSFGVVLVELISSLPAVDMARESNEVKLANLAIRKIQRRAFGELVDPSLGYQSDENIKRTITSVAELAFQCLQGDKDLRPSMGEVLEELQGIESGKDVAGCLEGIDVHGA
ncbi:hypothetical protein RIF29_15343 [Crotalaria pallida]|uniref:Protein kinase domain-containing protein n=1 Tax=Crotalaria pallida TaxID=3830 RepID=A0AAN9FIX9_CROPI